MADVPSTPIVKPHLVDTALWPVRGVGGVLAATLPRRLWNDWEGRVPVRAAALPAALLTTFLAFAIGIPAFLHFAAGMGSTIGDAVIEAGHQANAGKKPEEAGAYTWFGMMFAFPAFLFATPTGWMCLYLGGSGVVRLLSWAADDPRGDPLIEGADTMARRWHARRLGQREQAARNAREGDEAPDLLIRGRALGLSDAVYAVVASRLKPGWDPGVFLLTQEGRLRVGARLDRRFPEGLRAVYPLGEVAAVEVTRRGVEYSLPALSDYDPMTRRIAPPVEAPPSKSESREPG
jgi:hypothetical protein